MFISLCHATYHSKKKPLAIKNLWLERAIAKELIEYIPGLNSDDYESYNNTLNIKRFIRPKTNLCTAVDNWNGSAKLAKGDLIFVIADVLIPPYGWDIKIKELINGLSPKKHAFAIKINDSKSQNDKKLRHPIISRKFYEKYVIN